MALEHRRKMRMTVEEFFELMESDPDFRYEYIDGEVYMMTGGKREHALLCNKIGSIFDRLLQDKPCLVFNSDACVQISETRYVCPDLTISCDPRDDDRTDEPKDDDTLIRYPCLVVEVLSPGTRSRDRNKKVRLYQACATIQDYLIIDAESPTVWHYQRQANELWAINMYGLEDTIQLASIHARFPVAEIYAKTRFRQQ